MIPDTFAMPDMKLFRLVQALNAKFPFINLYLNFRVPDPTVSSFPASLEESKLWVAETTLLYTGNHGGHETIKLGYKDRKDGHIVWIEGKGCTLRVESESAIMAFQTLLANIAELTSHRLYVKFIATIGNSSPYHSRTVILAYEWNPYSTGYWDLKEIDHPTNLLDAP